MSQKNKLAVYLAGGFRSGWQEVVKAQATGIEMLDPSEHSLEDPAEYTNWDLAAIRRADIVLAYMERDNPGGYSLALEVGYAHALGKRVFFVEEHPSEQRARYFEMVRQVSDKLFTSLEEAVAELVRLT